MRSLSIDVCDLENISALSKLKHLQNLGLSHNKIKNVASLKELQHLETINLRNNLITDLEPLIGLGLKFVHDEDRLSPNKNEILISNCNNITNPPIEIVKQGNEAIQRYFRRIKEEGFDYIYEAKLILVGEGSSGKTSLKRRLLDEKAPLPESDKRTRGIEVVDFIFHKENNANQIAHIWDFGGQDVYYPVHRFFITENSVFVLLASTRQTSHNFDYWIPTIFQFGDASPIIIGQTCHEGNTAPWNDVDIYLGNPNFNIIKTLEKPYYRIDLPNNNLGLPVIKKCIINQLRNLHHFGKGVPKSWLTIRTELNKLSTSNSCMPFQQLIDLCRKLEPDSFKYIQDIEDCYQFFHDIGVILWYSQIEELREWVVLQPEWAMNAVYKIIDDNDIQDRNGLILQDDFKRLWSEVTYEGKHNFLKKMLETFKIAFPKRHNQGEYIIPARLTSMPKEKKWGLEEKCLRLEYKFEFMPRGIVNQITSELSRYIYCNEVWNNAVTLAYENNYTKCQILEDSYNRSLSIVSKGIDARGMNILVMNSIRNIIESYKGVKEEIYVNCTCPVCQKLEVPTTFLYSKLIEWSAKREGGTVTCNESGESLVIADLLYNAGFEKVSRKAETPQKNKTVSIFLASSEELKDDREAFENFINRENKELNKSGIFLHLEIWEDFIDKMSKTRLQDEYNKAVIKSDIFLSLFWTKAGMYTQEEFKVSFDHYKNNGKPYVYTYFKDEPIAPSRMNEGNLGSLINFREELKQLGHYPTVYKNIDDLKYQFKMQLQKILPELS